MCGLAGITGLEALSDPQAVVGHMTDALAHRGPNAAGVWTGESTALGHCRLSIIDLSPTSDQPFRSSDGRCVLVFNGEIYNYRELRQELEGLGHVFRTNSDTEVLLMAYLQWGQDMLGRLHGMFAFAIQDERRQELFIARDRLGIKPLYYHQGDRHFVFASELRSLLASGVVPKRLDPDSLVDHLRYQTVHAPYTILKDVYMLLPGHSMVVSDAEVRVQQWWDPNRSAMREAAGMDLATVRKEIRARAAKAVERRLVADVPFGAFLSGGIDSSAVVGLMAEVSEAPIHTLSVVFDEEAYSEERYAAMVARKFGTRHNLIRLRAQDMLKALPEVMRSMDHPSADGANTWIVSRATRQQGLSMALSGLGGDELFAGYPVFQHVLALWDRRYITQFPIWTRRIARTVLSRVRPEFGRSSWSEALLLGAFTVDATYPLSRLQASDHQLRGMLVQGDPPPNRVAAIMHRIIREEGGYDLPFLGQVSLGELSTYLPNVLLRDTDQMSMAHALEVRVPFLDHELVEFVLGVSDKQKYPHTPKQLLVSSLGDLLPREIVDRPKMGFVFPWKEWMLNELRPFCEQRIKELGRRPMFRPGVLEAQWNQLVQGDPKARWLPLWSMVLLEEWLQLNGVEA